MAKFLTKSRFKIGCECPSKLVYLDNPEYGNSKSENTFLAALAEGGFQVGALAKVMFPGGVEVETKEKKDAVAQTKKLLEQKNVVIFEGAFQYKDLFIRVDVINKVGNEVELIEVKAKSFDSSEHEGFFSKRVGKGGKRNISSEWESYLVDVAFQSYVFGKSEKNLNCHSFLMLADKSKTATVDGLNQNFFLEKDKKETKIVLKAGVSEKTIGQPVLTKVNVDQEVEVIWDELLIHEMPFEKSIEFFSRIVVKGEKPSPVIGSHCKGCEFRLSGDLKEKTKSGFEECWLEATNLKKNDLNSPLVFDIWNFRKSGDLIRQDKFLISEISEQDVNPSPSKDGVGLSSSERQWLQVEKVKTGDKTSFFDYEGFSREMKDWNFPLHFIDFETTMVAIPFNKGRRPYEQLAFQFSHHTVDQNGNVAHKDQFINLIKGSFPNYDFLRALKKSLETDGGTIFRFAAHENTVLCQIRDQINKDLVKIPDREELIEFIESITISKDEDGTKFEGERNMVDMCELVKKYYYHPSTKGSNSIKKVLPAILNESAYLKNLFSSPVYGSEKFPSLNYKNWKWVELDSDGLVKDPYKLLPAVFEDFTADELDQTITEGSIADGGSAMTAYSRMQFTQMSEAETKIVSNALLKYCELDTLAMVMIYAHWKNEVELKKKKAA